MWSRPDASRTPASGLPLLCTILMLAACQPGGPDALFERYLNKLGAALSVPIPPMRSSRVLPPPRAAGLQLDVSTDNLEGLDFLVLSGCAVQATVLKRNSALGRTAKPSQRLLLELEYLELAPACVTQLRHSTNDALADLLEDTWRLRREQLPALIFNATLGSDEYGAFWQTVAAPGEFPRVAPGATAAALAAINDHAHRWLGGDYRADNRDFELLLSEVAGGDGGALLQALSRQRDWLFSADLMLQPEAVHVPLCSAEIRDSVAASAREFFISEIEPRAANLYLRYRELQAPVVDLETQLAKALSPSYRNWMNDRNQRSVEYASAPQRHREQLERIQRSCRASEAMAKGRKLATLE